jgi:hypothetical protein
VQLHETHEFRAWLDERKTHFAQIHGEPDADRTRCEGCGITTSNAQLLDGTTCIECLAAEYGAHRLAAHLGGAFTGIVAAFASASPQQAAALVQHLGDRLGDAITDYDAERAGL